MSTCSLGNVLLLCQVMADMDVDDILAKQVEQLEKEKKELQEKLKSQEKKVSLLSLVQFCICWLKHNILLTELNKSHMT